MCCSVQWEQCAFKKTSNAYTAGRGTHCITLPARTYRLALIYFSIPVPEGYGIGGTYTLSQSRNSIFVTAPFLFASMALCAT